MCVVYGWISVNQHLEVNMSNNKQIEKPLELPHQETIVGTNTIQTKPFDNQKIMSNDKQKTEPMMISQTTTTNTAQGYWVKYLKIKGGNNEQQ